MDAAEASLRPNRTMSFSVDPRKGHDDFLMSLALLAQAVHLPAIRQARGHPPPNP